MKVKKNKQERKTTNKRIQGKKGKRKKERKKERNVIRRRGMMNRKEWINIAPTQNQGNQTYWKNISYQAKIHRKMLTKLNSFLNFWDEAWWFLSLRVFGLSSSSLMLFSTTFRLICPLAFFRCLSNSGTYTELRTTSFIKSTGVTCSDSLSHNTTLSRTVFTPSLAVEVKYTKAKLVAL